MFSLYVLLLSAKYVLPALDRWVVNFILNNFNLEHRLRSAHDVSGCLLLLIYDF